MPFLDDGVGDGAAVGDGVDQHDLAAGGGRRRAQPISVNCSIGAG
jgi:hypothetical protein